MAFEGTWKIFPLTMDEKTSYKLCEGDFYIRSDLEFVDSLLKDHRLEAEPQAREIILDLVCNLSRCKLVEIHSSVSVEDLEMAHLEWTDEMRRRPRQQALKLLVPLLPGSQPEV
ncbi:uncharacterized protein [Drosophila suzukii]|uniref:Uncharacterized protein n=1 Tax=Drosophila suzukii TaxID=28584 RepID=A0ABM4TV18_DROSZ